MIETLISLTSSILGIIGFCLTLFSLSNIQSYIFSFFCGTLLMVICFMLYKYIKSIPKFTEIEEIKIEAADEIPMFVPRKNKLNPICVTHTCEIIGCDAILEYDYFGICSSRKGCGHFSTSSHSYDISQIPDMDWYAFDLKDDPARERPIKPTVKTPQGSTQRVIFNFNRRVSYNCSFHYFTHQKCKNSIRESGKDYYASTVLYCNKPLSEYFVCLKFHERPICVNVYSVKNRKGTFLRTLTDCEEKDGIFIYTDHIVGETS